MVLCGPLTTAAAAAVVLGVALGPPGVGWPPGVGGAGFWQAKTVAITMPTTDALMHLLKRFALILLPPLDAF
jgi:hypothetical protein